ncbi:PREDICTED: scarecrow-like protein 18-like [Fragaria vesca subsp. vesca]
MGSFNSSHHQRIVPQQQEDQDHPQIHADLQLYNQHHRHHPQYQIPQPPLLMSRGLTARQLLIRCAELISQLDFSSAHGLISILASSNYSPHGDSTERLVHQFVRALSLRLPPVAAAPPDMARVAAATGTSAASTSSALSLEVETEAEEETLQSCYLTLNQITPFIRFSHLTANQAILEAIDSSHHAIHILDFDIKHGVQWPPLMQALVERSYGSSSSPPPLLRITATGRDLTLLRRTGERLLRFAQSLGLTFHFRPIVLLNDVAMIDYLNPASLGLFPNEALAVNCVLYLHRLLTDDARDLHLFLDKIRALNPKIVTVAEREANHNSPMFLNRFVEAVDHYGAVFGSLEATLPPNSRERLAVEQMWFGREIADVVAADDDQGRKQLRHERYENWEMMMRRSGFSNVPLSPFALSQAKLLLRLHYPSEGYQLHSLKDSFFLGWMNRPLFSVSSWN